MESKNVYDRERIIYSTHPRLFLYSSSIFLKFIAILILFCLFPFAIQGAAKIEYFLSSIIKLPLAQIVTWIFIIIIFILILSSIINLLSWKCAKYILTDRRVIIEEGLIRKNRSSIHYNKIVDVIFSQSFIERLMSAGDLQIFGGHEHTTIVLKNAPNPEKLDQLINRLIEQYQMGIENKTGDLDPKPSKVNEKPIKGESLLKRHSKKFRKLKK